MKNCLKNLRRQWEGSLLTKLLATTVLVLLIPFMISNAATYIINYQAILAESVNSNEGLLTAGINQWKDYIDTLENASLVFYESVETKELLRRTAPFEAVEEYSLRERLAQLLREDSSFRRVEITANNGSVLSQEKLGRESRENWRSFTGLTWDDGQRISVGYSAGGVPTVFVFRKELVDYPDVSVIGSFQLYCDLEGLSSIAETINGVRSGQLRPEEEATGVVGFFDRSSGQLLYSTDPMDNIVYQGYGKGWLRGKLDGTSGFFFLAHCDYKGIPLKAVRFVSAHTLLSGLHRLLLRMLLVQMVMLIMVITFVLFVYRSMVRPIRDIAANMVKVEEGVYEYTSQVTGTDEIAVLDKTYAEMVGRINQLINQEYKSALEISRTRLKLLQAQINPHFLNNMLQNISTRALKEGSRDTYNLLTRLARIFQYNMDMSADCVPLEQEFVHITNYLTLQRERFRENMDFTLQCSEDAGRINIPKMILQPLVENSLTHGIRGREGMGLIQVEAYTADSALHIIVSDNGAGMDAEKISALKSTYNGSYTINTTQGHGIGFLNVLYRLNLHTAGNFSWDVRSEPMVKTVVSLHIGRKEIAQ